MYEREKKVKKRKYGRCHLVGMLAPLAIITIQIWVNLMIFRKPFLFGQKQLPQLGLLVLWYIRSYKILIYFIRFLSIRYKIIK